MSAFGTKEDWIRMALTALLSAGLSLGCVALYRPSQPMFDQDAFLKVVRQEMQQQRTVTETSKQQTGAIAKEKDTARNTVVERYNAQGQVTYRRTSNSTSTARSNSNYEVVEAVKQDTVATRTIQEETIASSSIRIPDAVVRREQAGLGVGLLVTSRGMGPAATIRILSHDRISLDGVGGISNGSPKAGVGVSAEVLPNLNIGANVLVSPQDENVQLTHPAIPFVGITPGITFQYRF